MAELATVQIALALVWRGDRLLITRRPEGVHLAGYWEFPGGKIGAGETPERAAEREVLEEVGIGCRARATRPSLVHEYPERRVALHPVDCDWVGGEVQLLGVADARWVAVSELAAYAFPAANAALLDELRRAQR